MGTDKTKSQVMADHLGPALKKIRVLGLSEIKTASKRKPYLYKHISHWKDPGHNIIQMNSACLGFEVCIPKHFHIIMNKLIPLPTMYGPSQARPSSSRMIVIQDVGTIVQVNDVKNVQDLITKLIIVNMQYLEILISIYRNVD